MRRFIAVVAAIVVAAIAMPAGVAAETGIVSRLEAISPDWLDAPRDVNLGVVLDVPVTGKARVTVTQSISPLIGRSDIAAATNNDSTVASTQVFSQLTPVTAGENYVSLVVPGDSFNFPSTGVYVLTVTSSISSTQDSFQVLLPFASSAADIAPTKVLPLWTITSPPALTADGPLIAADVAQLFAPEGPLTAAVSGASGRADLMWLIDPDTVTTARAIANGVGTLDGEISDADRANAAAWLESLKFATFESSVYALPFANVDINALINNDLSAVARLSLDREEILETELGRLAVERAVVGARGDFSQRTWRWLKNQPVNFAITSDIRYPSADDTYTSDQIKQLSSGATMLVVDNQSSRQFSGAITSNSMTLIRRQALLADLLMITLERPNDNRVVVLKPNTSSSGVDFEATNDTLNSLDVPWIQPISSAAARDYAPAIERVAKDEPVPGRVTRFAVKDTWWVQRALNRLDGLIGGTPVETAIVDAQIRLTSLSYLDGQVRAMRLQLLEDIRNTISRVEIMSTGSVVFSSEEGLVPITIRNDLSIPITIRVIGVGQPAVRVIPSDVGLIEIQPGKRKSIEIPTRLVGSDIAYLNLQLADSEGKPFGTVTRIQLASSAYAQAAVWVIGIATILLVVFVIANAVRNRRKKAAAIHE